MVYRCAVHDSSTETVLHVSTQSCVLWNSQDALASTNTPPHASSSAWATRGVSTSSEIGATAASKVIQGFIRRLPSRGQVWRDLDDSALAAAVPDARSERYPPQALSFSRTCARIAAAR